MIGGNLDRPHAVGFGAGLDVTGHGGRLLGLICQRRARAWPRAAHSKICPFGILMVNAVMIEK
jgi:hypothetical protein